MGHTASRGLGSWPRWLAWTICLAIIGGSLVISGPALGAQGPLIRISGNQSSADVDVDSAGGVVSADGRYVAFSSGATDLVPGDSNRRDDVFRYDRTTGQVAPVSVTASGGFLQTSHGLPVISGDGRYVAFWSEGVFDAADVPRTADVILRDMATGAIERLTVAPDGSGKVGVDRVSNRDLAITDDGRWVVFESSGTNLVVGDIEDGEVDLFVRDRQAGVTNQLSVESTGLPGASSGVDAVVAGSGAQAYVGFRVQSADRSTGRMVVRNLGSGTEVDVLDLSEPATRQSSVLALAAGGAKVIVSMGTASVPLEYDTTTLESTPLQDDVDWNAVQAANFSADLRFFVAPFIASGSTTFLVVDRVDDETTELPHGFAATTAVPDQASNPTSISDNGTLVAFSSLATNLVPGDTNGLADSFIVSLARGTFSDDDDNPFEADIEWLAAEGVTQGCGPDLFCPAAPVTREQMASFLVRALDLPASTRDGFTDDETSAHEADINALAAAGITQGCGPGLFCPTMAVSRQEMASFLTRAFDLPAGSTDFFDDDAGSLHEQDINALAQAGVTLGCASRRYCPFDQVRRDQMAAFLHRALS